MFFLLLAMMASSVLAIVLRYINTGYAYGVYFINYVTCAVLAFATLEGKTLWTGDPTPLWLGAVAGFFYLSSLAAHGYSIHKNGAILSSVFTRVLVPIFPALLLFHGRTTPAQGLGVGLAVLAAVVMNGLPQKHQRSTGGKVIYPLALVLALLLNEASDSMSKIFAQLGRRQNDGLSVFYIFLFAELFTIARHLDVLIGPAGASPTTKQPGRLVCWDRSVSIWMPGSGACGATLSRRQNTSSTGRSSPCH